MHRRWNWNADDSDQADDHGIFVRELRPIDANIILYVSYVLFCVYVVQILFFDENETLFNHRGTQSYSQSTTELNGTRRTRNFCPRITRINANSGFFVS